MRPFGLRVLPPREPLPEDRLVLAWRAAGDRRAWRCQLVETASPVAHGLLVASRWIHILRSTVRDPSSETPLDVGACLRGCLIDGEVEDDASPAPKAR